MWAATGSGGSKDGTLFPGWGGHSIWGTEVDHFGAHLDGEAWDSLQRETFITWINSILQERNMEVISLERDFSDGVKLINLIEILSGKVIRHNRNPRMRAHRADNNEMALIALKSLGITSVGYSAQALADGKSKQIMGVIWLMMQKLSFQPKNADVAANSTPATVESPAAESSQMVVEEEEDDDTDDDEEDGDTTTDESELEEQARVRPERAATPTLAPIGAVLPPPLILSARTHMATAVAATVSDRPPEQADVDADNSNNDSIGTTELQLPPQGDGFSIRQRENSIGHVGDAQAPLPPPLLLPLPESLKLQLSGELHLRDAQTPQASPPKPPLGRSYGELLLEPLPAPPVEATPDVPPCEDAPPVPPAAASPLASPSPSLSSPLPADVSPASDTKSAETPKKRRKKKDEKEKKTKKKKKKQPAPVADIATAVSEVSKGNQDDGETAGGLCAEAVESATRSPKRGRGSRRFSVPALPLIRAVVDAPLRLQLVEVAPLVQALARAYLARTRYQRLLSHSLAFRALIERVGREDPRVVQAVTRLQAVWRGRRDRAAYRRKQRRTTIAREILMTEQTYVSRLDLLMQVYYKPLLGMGDSVFNQRIVKSIFSQVEVILNYNRTLLSRLEQRMQNWHSLGQCLGDIFLQVTVFLKVYTTYVNNYNTTIQLLTDAAKNREAAKFLTEAALKTNGLHMGALLILPIQRIPRYVLLLQDLLRHTDSGHTDHVDLVKALKEMRQVADYINEKKREAEALNLVPVPLALPTRRYLRRGTLNELEDGNKKKRFRHYWLFNDLLVATKPAVAKGAKWRGKVFGSSAKKSARSATVSGPPPTPPAAPAATAESGKPSTPRGSAQAGLDGEEGVAGVLEEGAGYTYRHMVPLRKCELRNVSDASAEKRWGRRNVFQLINADLHIITFEASADLEILRHRLGQAVGLGVGMGSINLGPDLALAVKDVDLGPDLSADKQQPQMRSNSSGGVSGVGSPAVIVETAKALAGAEMFGPLYKHTSTDQWSLRWFVLKNFVLYIFKRKPEPNERPIRFIPIASSTVKLKPLMDREHSFQLGTPSRIYFLSAEDAQARVDWVSAIRRSIYALLDLQQQQQQQQDISPTAPSSSSSSSSSSCASSSSSPAPSSTQLSVDASPRGDGLGSAGPSPRINGSSSGWRRQLGGSTACAGGVSLAEVLATPANRVCAECGAEPVAWASLKFYTLLCAECKGIHQELFQERDLVSLARIREREKRGGKDKDRERERDKEQPTSARTTAPDDFPPDTLEILQRTGNERANEMYERGVRNLQAKPGPKDARSAKVAWVRAKYQDLLADCDSSDAPASSSSSSKSGDREQGGRSERAGNERRREKEEDRDRERRRERDAEAAKVGYLGRLKTNPTGWVKNWFVLTGISLNWHKTKEDTGRSGVIKLVICYTRVRPEHDGLFEIVTPTQIHTLLASSKEEMNLWLSAIATAMSSFLRANSTMTPRLSVPAPSESSVREQHGRSGRKSKRSPSSGASS